MRCPNEEEEDGTAFGHFAIVVENPDSVEQLNALLHEYRNVIIGRMGVPYPKRKVSLVSVALDAPMDVVSALSGKVGRLPG